MDIYAEITNRMIAEMEQGIIPWRQPWQAAGAAISHTTGKPYSLLNQMLLGRAGEYATFKQVQQEGGWVRKGEKASMVVFWKWIDKEDEETGEVKQVPFLRYYNVFHIDQCEGLEAKHSASIHSGTLILLESSALIEQWQSALERFLIIDEELPSYSTPTGRVKRRKSHIGWLQGQHDSLSGIVDIAMAGSLCKKGTFHPLLQEYGMVIVDECHHAATDTMANVLQHIKARYVYGVTATPIRGDGLEKINHMLMGPIRYRYTSRQRAQAQGIRHLVYPRFTRTVNPYKYGEKTHPNDAYELLRNNDVRDQQIVNDIVQCVDDGRTPVVLTKYTEHAEHLYDQLKDAADHVFLYMGTMKKKEQKQLRAELLTVGPEESLILIATGQLIGEGFDFPRLDTLFLATPVAWKGVVEQYAGRLNRDYEGKQDVIIYDYLTLPMVIPGYSAISARLSPSSIKARAPS